ncbi:MAG: PAS domain S-box protein [Planctomycetes bacterium]|nr:PAS domain S-box protein [Planctomycetota bacterium]
MAGHLRVLIVEDSEYDTLLMVRKLQHEGYEVVFERVETAKAMSDALDNRQWDIVLADYTMPHFSGTAALALLKEKGVDIPFIIVTGTMSDVLAVTAMKAGAHDYIMKDNMVRLPAAVVRELREAEVRREKKLADNALREKEEWVRAISESANDAIICIDDTGIVIFWNKKAEETFGYSTYEAIDKPVCNLIIPERYRKQHTEGLKAFSKTGTGPVVGKPIELSSLRKDGTEFPIELSVSGMKIKEKWHAIGIIRDITKRKRSEERISIQLQQLNTLREIDKVITSTLDMSVSLDMFLEKALAQLRIDAADVLLFDQQTQELEYIAARGFRKFIHRHRHMRLGEGVVGRIAAERRIRCIQNLSEVKDEWIHKELITDELFTAYCGLPLVAKGQLKGVFEIFHHAPFSGDPEWMNFVETIAGQAAVAIDNITLFEDLQRSNTEIIQAYDDTIEGWSRALDMRDKETEGHCRRVTEMTLTIARAMNIPKEHHIHIRRGALLHDIGKVGIPDSILQKPGPLTEEEWVIMRKHPIYAYELLSPVAYLRPAMDIPYCHHEKWDGTGYPRGLKGEEIPIAARVFAVIDVWEALRSVRVYKPAWPEEKVREHIRSLAGTHFDPKVVEVFLGMKQ